MSVGIGSMAVFGSYIGKERTLLGESVTVCLLDTAVALLGGLIFSPPVLPSALTRERAPVWFLSPCRAFFSKCQAAGSSEHCFFSF